MNMNEPANRESPRERLFKALDGRRTKTAAVWLLFPYHPTRYYVDVLNHPAYRTVFDVGRDRGVIVLNRRNIGTALHTPEVKTEVEETVTGTVKRTLRYRDIRLTSEKPMPGGKGRKLLSTDEDLEAFCALPIEDRETHIRKTLEAQIPTYLRERAEFPTSLGAMMLDLGSPVNFLYHESDLEAFAVWSLTHATLIEDWLERAMARLEIIYRYCLEHDLADVYFLVGSELAAPPLVSLETFRRWVVPYESRLIRLIHSFGKKVIQHFHGNIRALLPYFVEMAPDGLHTIEAPPVGDCTLSEAFMATQERITLIGNVQYDEFRSLDPVAMRRRVREILQEVNGRRFILSPTAGPFDPDPPRRVIENYVAFLEAVTE